MSKYIPLPPPQDVESIPLYLQNELQKMSQALEQTSEEIDSKVQEGVADIESEVADIESEVEDLEATVSGISGYTPTEAGFTKHQAGNITGTFNSAGTSAWSSGYSTGDMTHTLSASGSYITIDEDMDIVANFDAHMNYYANTQYSSGNYYLYVAMYRRRNGVDTQIAGPTGIYQYTPTDRGDSTYPMTLAYSGSVQDGDQISIRVRGLTAPSTGYMRVLSASFTVRKV